MIGMKVATVCTPPPTPSASSAVSHGGLPMPSSTCGRAVDQQRAGELVEEVDEGAAEVDGEQEQQIHHREEDRNAGQPVQDHPVDAVGDGSADDAFALHRFANQRVGEAVAAVGDEDVAVFVGTIGRLLGDPHGGLTNARRHHGPRALVTLQQLDAPATARRRKERARAPRAAARVRSARARSPDRSPGRPSESRARPPPGRSRRADAATPSPRLATSGTTGQPSRAASAATSMRMRRSRATSIMLSATIIGTRISSSCVVR